MQKSDQPVFSTPATRQLGLMSIMKGARMLEAEQHKER